MDQKFISKIDAFIENNKENMFNDMARVIAVNSVRGEAEEGAPYGKGPRKALEVALTIAEELGLKTRNCEDILGYAALDGEEEGYLATIAHLDVVPAGEGWNSDPFTLTRRDGHLIGRGILDDKGPALICLYAMKFLKEEGIKLRYPIRALLATDEEKGMSDVKYYLKN